MQLHNGSVIKSELTDENIFNHCPDCGKEVHVDLADLFHSDNEVDLHRTAVLCITCAKARMKGAFV